MGAGLVLVYLEHAKHTHRSTASAGRFDMGTTTMRDRDLFMEIKEAMGVLGEWKAEGKVGRKVINRFVHILEEGVDDPRSLSDLIGTND